MEDLRLTEAAEDMLDEEFGESQQEWEFRQGAIDKANELARRDGRSCINGTTMRHAIEAYLSE